MGSSNYIRVRIFYIIFIYFPTTMFKLYTIEVHQRRLPEVFTDFFKLNYAAVAKKQPFYLCDVIYT